MSASTGLLLSANEKVCLRGRDAARVLAGD
jgi:hypothetical protein